MPKCWRAMGVDKKEHIYTESAYVPGFPAKAKALGGGWLPASKRWVFDPRDEARVRALLIATYGTDGSEDTPADLVTLHVALDALDLSDELWVCGRQVARRADRDYSVRLGENVIAISGGFYGYGGSRKHPQLNPQPGTVLEVRDVPRVLAEQEIARLPQGISLLQETPA